MSNPRTQLAEALAILGTLAATVKAQQIETLRRPDVSTRTFAVTVSENGDWIAGWGMGINDRFEYGNIPLRWHRGSTEFEQLDMETTSGIGIASITDNGTIFGQELGRLGLRVGAWTSIGFQPMFPEYSSFGGVSADGASAVINQHDAEYFWSSWIYRGTLPILELPRPSDRATCSASGMSADGSTVVGVEYRFVTLHNITSSRYFPLRWVDGELSALPTGGRWSVGVRVISSDGRVAGGFANEGFDSTLAVPVLWVGDAEPRVVGPAGLSGAGPLSADGRLVKVGPGIWTPEGGYRTDLDYLVSRGLNAAELTNVTISDASGDATILAAILRPNADLVVPIRITLPPPCHLDYATDGMVDFFDYVAFVACFEGDCPNYRSADFNMDGFVDWADYAGFVEAFEIGC